jgi:hypothetical protein
MNKADIQEAKKDQEIGLVVPPSIELKPGDIMTATTIEPLV